MQNPEQVMANYLRQVDEIGNIHDPRMLLTVDTPDEIAAIHARNAEHLHAYVRARRIHAEIECEAGTICSGPAVSSTIVARDIASGDRYTGVLGLSAIALLDTVMAERDELAARVMRLEMEHDEQDALRRRAEELLTAASTEVAELTARVAACEALIAEHRAGWPAT